MPYEIKEKKGKKAKKFSVVNKDTGKVMSKGTTEKKAKKQIKAIYANMRPEHRVRHRIGLMEGASIKHPVHRAIINDVRKVLKKEEIHGSGLWDWFTKQFPVLSLVLSGTKPEDVVNAVKDYGADAIGALLEPWTFPFAVASAIHNTNQDSPQVNPYQQSMYPEDEDDYEYDDYEIDFANIHNANDYEDDDLFEEEEADIYNEVAEDIQDEKQYKKQDENKSQATAEKIDKLVEKIMEDEGIPSDERHGLDDALRFPMIYNYDENNKPMYLQEWLLSSGVAGKNFAVEEFGNTVRNQEPYAFLNFPINGGRLGKINYSQLGYSKY